MWAEHRHRARRKTDRVQVSSFTDNDRQRLYDLEDFVYQKVNTKLNLILGGVAVIGFVTPIIVAVLART